MPEGLVYVCSWKKVEDGFETWVKRRPSVRGMGDSFEDAAEWLFEEVMDAFEDGEPVLEFDPPAPSDHASSTKVAPIVVIGANARPDRFRQATEAMVHGLYSNGLCEVCCGGLGKRTAQPWFIGYFSASTEILFTGHPVGDRRLVSELFLSALTKKERASFEWRPVLRQQGRKRFYELIAKKIVPCVAIRGRRPSGWRCPRCGYKAFYPAGPGSEAVCEEDLPSPLPSCFAIGDQRETALCMTLKRWKELVGRRETKGCTTKLLIVLPKSTAIYDPRLRSYGSDKGSLVGSILPRLPHSED